MNKWTETDLESILVDFESGKRPKGGVSGICNGIPSLGGEHLNPNGLFNFKNIKYVPKNFANNMKKGHIKLKDILIVKDGATTGKISFVDKNFAFSNAVINEHLFRCHVSEKINSKFVFYFLYSGTGQKRILSNFKGTAQGGINTSFAPNTLLPIAPIDEQNRIVEKIEELFSDLDKATEDLKKTQKLLKIYRQAVLKAAFEGKLTEEWRKKYNTSSAELLFRRVFNKRKEIYKRQQFKKCKKLKHPEKFYKKENTTEMKFDDIPYSWKQIKFIDLIKYEENSIKRGPFGSAIKKAFFVPKGYKVYEQKNAINNDAILGNYFIDEAKYKELERFSVKGDDYIISCSGTIGRISKLPKDASIGVINQALLKIVLDEDLFIDKLFLYLFRAEFFQRKILKETRGSAMKNIASVEDIKNIDVLLPSKEEQEKILQEIESRLSVCDKLEETVQQSLEKIGYLRQSILKKAFEGKLVPQDPNDEPAEKLLERIKQEKEKFESNNKKRKKR